MKAWHEKLILLAFDSPAKFQMINVSIAYCIEFNPVRDLVLKIYLFFSVKLPPRKLFFSRLLDDIFH
jgi:hypothetical protein